MGQPSHVTANVYLQVEPEWAAWMIDGVPVLRGAKAVNLTKRMPREQRGGTVLVKLAIRLPAAAFLPLRPSAVVIIPDNLTIAEPIEVTVEDPRDE